MAQYVEVLTSLKEKIRSARQQSILAVNTHLIAVYYEIGKVILQQQIKEGWGAKVIDRLSVDLRIEFPDMKGFSVRNIKYMRAFAEAWSDFSFVQQVAAQIQDIDNHSIAVVQRIAAQIPWGHHQVLLDKVKSREEREFYLAKILENGWSRNVLVAQIDTRLFHRQGNAITNFTHTLPTPLSDLAQETLKNPYNLEFTGLSEEIQERELEKALIIHIQKFMLELGRGFAYVGNQKNLCVEGDDYFLDLLFFNYQLNCFVIFELKVSEFKPEYAGKLNFYVNTVNEQLKGPEHKPTIGVLLCKTPNKTVVQYSLKGIDTPIGVSDYELVKSLPTQLKGEIPTVEELEAEIEKEYEELIFPPERKFDTLKEKLANAKL